MEEKIVERGEVRLYSRCDGAASGPTLVFANSLGTDHRLWDAVLPHLPAECRVIRWDKRGHGRSSAPKAPYSMGALISDCEAVCDAWDVSECHFVGLSIGGLIAQGLAVKRPGLMRLLTLSNTAARIGTPKLWDDRIAAVRAEGLEPLADAVMQRWFSRRFRSGPQVNFWRDMVCETSPEGYAGCCAAISGSDFWASTATITLPTLVIAGSEDGSTPPDLVFETADLISHAHKKLIRGAGHLPCVEATEDYAALLVEHMRQHHFL